MSSATRSTRSLVRQYSTGSSSTSRSGPPRAGGPRRTKRLASVFETGQAKESSPSKSTSQRRQPAPETKTDWDSPLYSRAGFSRPLSSVPREGEKQPTIRDAVMALKLHLGPGGRQSLGPIQRPTQVLKTTPVTGQQLSHELKQQRIARMDQEIGGDYSAYLPSKTGTDAVSTAEQATWRNQSLDMEARKFVLDKVSKNV